MFEQEATLLEQGAIMFEQEGFLGNIQKSPLKFGVSVCFLPKNQTKFAFGWFPKYTKVCKKRNCCGEIAFLSSYIAILSPDIGFLSLDIGFLSPDIGFLSPEIGFLSSEIEFLSPDIAFLSPEIEFLDFYIEFLKKDVYKCLPK